MSLKKFIHQTSIPRLLKTCLTSKSTCITPPPPSSSYFVFCFFNYTIQMLVITSSKFCETSTDNVPLLVWVTQSAFIIPFNITLQMHNFIFFICLVSDQNTMNAHLQKGLMQWAYCTCVCTFMFGSSSVENPIFKMCPLFFPKCPWFLVELSWNILVFWKHIMGTLGRRVSWIHQGQDRVQMCVSMTQNILTKIWRNKGIKFELWKTKSIKLNHGDIKNQYIDPYSFIQHKNWKLEQRIIKYKWTFYLHTIDKENCKHTSLPQVKFKPAVKAFRCSNTMCTIH